MDVDSVSVNQGAPGRTCGPIIPRLPADIALKVMAAAAGRPLNGPLTNACFRAILPFAETRRDYYRAFKAAVREVEVHGGENISDEEILNLVHSHPNLVGLYLSSAVPVTDHGATLLALSPAKLRKLRLGDAHLLTDASMRALIQSNMLEHLDFSNCPNLTTESAKFLGRFSALKELRIAKVNCADDSFFSTLIESWVPQALTKLKLTRLPSLSNDGISMIAAAVGTQLEVLKIRGCKKITDAALKAVASQCPNLIELDVSQCHLLTSDGVMHLSEMQNLEVLALGHLENISDASIVRICERRKLKHIDVSFCERLTDATAFALAKCLNMSTVMCHGLRGLTDAGVVAIAGLPFLTSAKFPGCTKLTDNALDALAGARNAPLNLVDVRNCLLFSVKRLQRMANANECATLMATDWQFRRSEFDYGYWVRRMTRAQASLKRAQMDNS